MIRVKRKNRRGDLLKSRFQLLYCLLLYRSVVEITLDAYLFDCLLPDLVGHDRRAASFIIYLHLYRHASQQANWSVRLSISRLPPPLASHKAPSKRTSAHLQNRQLIATSRAHPTAVPLHRVLRPWLRLNRKKS